MPVIVHLLNRRRFRVVQWAAMDFLREALTRSRRMMELRDLLLLLLRVACLLAFGMALARPYWNRFSQAAVDPNQPVHAVVLVDNSLSMSYQKPDGILLDDAKAKAKELIEGLPSGSVISVLPTCGSATGVNYEAYARREDALEALAAIRPVDCAARSGPVIDRALEACRRTTSMAGRRIFLVTDQQVADWSADAEMEHLKQLPCPMQVVQVAADQIENVWVADVQLREGVANAQCPAVFIATIGYQGGEPRKGIPVVLKVDGKQVASQTIDLQPGQMREVIFPEYEFSAASAQPRARPATPRSRSRSRRKQSPSTACRTTTSGRSWCRWPTRCRWSSSIPWGPTKTRRRRFSATPGGCGDGWPRQSGRPGQDRPLVQIRHLTIDQLTRKALADARLVVIAGVSRPSPAEVSLLKQYVEQGGNLLLAAGGNFDPAAWTEAAWQDGLGILPAPLAPTAQGYVREDRRWATSKTRAADARFCQPGPSLFPAGGSQRRRVARRLGAADVLPEDRRGPVRQGLAGPRGRGGCQVLRQPAQGVGRHRWPTGRLGNRRRRGRFASEDRRFAAAAGEDSALVADLEEGRRPRRRRAIVRSTNWPSGPGRRSWPATTTSCRCSCGGSGGEGRSSF